MRKFINTLMAVVMLGGFTVVLSGCTDESGVKTETTIKNPDGSKTTETRETKIDKNGENPPAAPSERK
jgi:hypothetical protein